jgi:hypothetical protein
VINGPRAIISKPPKRSRVIFESDDESDSEDQSAYAAVIGLSSPKKPGKTTFYKGGNVFSKIPTLVASTVRDYFLSFIDTHTPCFFFSAFISRAVLLHFF